MIDGSESDTGLHQRSGATINDASTTIGGFIIKEDRMDQIDRETGASWGRRVKTFQPPVLNQMGAMQGQKVGPHCGIVA